MDDKIGVQGPSYSASYQPAQLPHNCPMVESSVQFCPPEDGNSDSAYDEYDAQDYEVDISVYELGHEDL